MVLAGSRSSARRAAMAVAVLLAVAGVTIILVRATTPTAPGADDVVAASAGAERASSACRGVSVRPGDDVQRMLDERGSGATICFAAGTYRLDAPLRPTRGQRLVADRGAVLTGARPVRDWRRDGTLWVTGGALPDEPTVHGECVDDRPCRFSETLFLDGRPLRRVASRDGVSSGRYWADYESNQLWIADAPGGRDVQIARAPGAVEGEARDVVIEGFVVERFANPAQRGAIHAGVGWTITHNEVRANHGTGIHATSGRVIANRIHHNGQLGLLGTGSGLLVEGNEIDHNNTAGFSALWEAGGTKFAFTEGLVVRGNDVHDNVGPGLWTDINNVDSTIERNLVRDNTSHGIFHEISYSATIRHNRVTDNGLEDPLPGWGGAGIRIAASRDVDVYGNVLIGNQNAVMLVQQHRTDWPSPRGPHIVDNIEVHDNEMTVGPDMLTGLVDDTGSADSYARDIRFNDNTYLLQSADAAVFAWRGTEWGRRSWRTRFEQDTSSTFRLPG